ncbi:antibiotic biosynthesis monooxygenase family protein [Balneatrix alpica]|uniref:Antibiotic biosynthesis monooxygenase family protein n=1 Tax=Balneatrix alpica TaxID=75684 RepID=A0ABV5Z706_9GAMM|nr:antibiotic biosynthesis monooxygenase [Balneatrix alpica]
MIKVLIERRIAPDMESTYDYAARQTLRAAMEWEGFISGEALKNVDNPLQRILIATYRSELDWQRWQASNERQEAMSQLLPLLLEPEKVTLLEHA